jgi:transglutaminase-like putative cysteine protease
MFRFALALFLVLPALVRSEPPPEQWFTVLLDGRKIGSFEATRQVHGDQVTTRQKLDIVLDRAGTSIALASEESSEETRAGLPLGFRSVTRMSGVETRIEGTVRDGTIHVRTHNGGGMREQTLAWPDGALLPEGQRLAGLRAGLEPGTRYRVLAFQPSSLDAIPVENVVGPPTTVELPDGAPHLVPVSQVLQFPGAAMRSQAWVDAEQTLHKLTLPMLGVDLTLLACDRDCALAPNQSSDVFARTLVTPPRALGKAELDGARYLLRSRDARILPHLPATGEQRVRRTDHGMQLDIRRHAQAGDEAPPQATDFVATDWLQSGAPEIVALARRGAGDASEPAERMRKLEHFVRDFIDDKNLGVGYASALEVARHPQGDCTEHAVLLAALGRAEGIATRIVNGLAWAPGFAGRDQVFVPHAWVQAWIDGRWQSFDAALDGFDAGHIALALGDGDPLRFYQGVAALGRIDIVEVEALEGVGVD